MLRALLLFLVFLTGSTLVFAQNGSISGVVTDSQSKEPVIGASVLIQGTQVGTMTDIEGKFSIPNVKPGTYSLAISFITYTTNVIPDVVVEGGKVTEIQVPMEEGSTALDEVVVTGTRQTNNDVSLMKAIKESKLVVSGISAQQIVKLPDNDAAQVMKRVPGITIVDNRFVMVRGVPERYNQVMINDAIAPSTEVDKRSFSFDLIPSGAVDQLLIYKSGSSDKPGDFAGGVIQVVTKQAPSEDYISFGLNFGYRDNTTFNTFAESNTSGTDFLGFDDGKRSLPASFPNSDQLKGSQQDSPTRINAARSLSGDFDYTTKNAPVDYGFNIGFAKNLRIGNVRASNLTNLSYSKSYQYAKAGYIRYGIFDSNPETTSEPIYNFTDNVYSNETKINLAHNWLFNIGSNSKIEFKNLFVQLGENKTTLRSGTDITSIPGLYNNYGYHYMSRSIYSGQLQGKFNSDDKRNTLSVMLGMNHVNRDEPDFRRFRTILDADRNQFRMIMPPSANLYDAGRFYSDLTDKGYSHALSFERKLSDDTEGKRVATIKAGYYTEYKTRTFNARYVSYKDVFNNEEMYERTFLPLSQIFQPGQMLTVNPDGTSNEGFSLQEGTDPTNAYEGENTLLAGYVSGSVPLGKFDLTLGFRLEHNDQKLITYKGDSTVHNVVTSPLPSLNLAYNLTDRSLIRLAYSRTVNRPEFRELAPFLFYQFEYNLNIQGNKRLKTASVDNIDLRWEMYPNPGESVSFGGFYKSFENPIEFTQQNASGNLQFGYGNAPKAYSYGVELEVRKSLASLGVSKFLRNTSVNLNTSLIKSEVDMGLDASTNTFQENKRPLQGQSPYVINVGLYYNDSETGWSANAGYNLFGNRIMAVGSTLFPSWIERPRQSLDLQVAKTFRNVEVKLNVQNVLNSQYRIYQDNDENQQIDEKIDDPIQRYKTGTLYALSIGWKFTKD
jgi:TonB-dependent receptor